MTRALSGAAEPIASSSPQPSTSISENTTAEASSLNRPVSTSAQAIHKPGSLAGESWTLLERAADEGLVIIRSPKVRILSKLPMLLKYKNKKFKPIRDAGGIFPEISNHQGEACTSSL